MEVLVTESVRVKKSLEQRIEEAIREEVSIVAYDPAWPQLFQREAEFLQSTLPERLIRRVEHFGSTAVPGLAAKPIIDILVEVASLREAQEIAVPQLEAKGYDYFWRTDCQPAYPWFIKRNAQGTRTHHIHMVEADSDLWERLYFRDYLREFPEEAERYAELKRSLSEKHPNDRIAYTQGKGAYVKDVTDLAKAYYVRAPLKM